MMNFDKPFLLIEMRTAPPLLSLVFMANSEFP